jgi:hypothetical protein
MSAKVSEYKFAMYKMINIVMVDIEKNNNTPSVFSYFDCNMAK